MDRNDVFTLIKNFGGLLPMLYFFSHVPGLGDHIWWWGLPAFGVLLGFGIRRIPPAAKRSEQRLAALLPAAEKDGRPLLIQTDDWEAAVHTDQSRFSGKLDGVTYHLRRRDPSKTDMVTPLPLGRPREKVIEQRLLLWHPYLKQIWPAYQCDWDGLRLKAYRAAHHFPRTRRGLTAQLNEDRQSVLRLIKFLFSKQTDPATVLWPEADDLSPDGRFELVINAAEERTPAEVADYLTRHGAALPAKYRRILAFYAENPCSDTETAELLFHHHEVVAQFARRVFHRLGKPRHAMLHYADTRPEFLERCLKELQQEDDRASVPHIIALLTARNRHLFHLPLILRQNDSRVLGFLHDLLERGSLEERRSAVHALAEVGDRQSIHLLRHAGSHIFFSKHNVTEAIKRIEGRHPRAAQSGSLSVVSVGVEEGMLSPVTPENTPDLALAAEYAEAKPQDRA